MKSIQGAEYWSPADYRYISSGRVERFTQKYLKFSLGIAVTLMVLAYLSLFAEAQRTFQFVTVYLPNITH